MTPPHQQSYTWDLFISYARENQSFVLKQLMEPLRHYRTTEGQPVKVFVDTLSLRAGVNWMVKVTDAILSSRVLVAVYSREFLSSENCLYELDRGASRDPLGARGMFLPIALSAAEGNLVPSAYDRFNWVNAAEEGWFEAVINTLGYRRQGQIQELAFEDEIRLVTAGAPLPPVRVEVLVDSRRIEDAQEIRLISETGTLRGTTTSKTESGVATFREIFFDSAVETTRLLATADGCSAVFSNPFPVIPVPAVETPKGDPGIDATGEVCFFGEPEMIGVAAGDLLQIFSIGGRRTGSIAIPRLSRMVRQCAAGLVFCGWDGSIVLAGNDGSRHEWTLMGKNGFCIPGDVADGFVAGELLVGMWSGEVWRLLPDGSSELHLRHPGGIQALEARGDLLLLADLERSFVVYSGSKSTSSVRTEPVIRRLKVFQDSVVLIGEEQIYEYRIDRDRIFSIGLPMSERIVTVYGMGEETVAVSRGGRGILFHRAEARQTFWIAEGCVPTSLDAEARFYVFRHPDQTYSLWHNRLPVVQGVTGGLAISRSGTHVAIGDGRGIKISLMTAILGSAGAAIGAN